MRFTLFISAMIALLLTSHLATAQKRHESFRIRQEAVQVEDMASPEIQHLFTESQEADIFSGERKRTRQVNYNVLLDIFYYYGRGDNIEFIDPGEVDSIKLDNRLFVHYKDFGFFEYIPVEGKEPLLLKHELDVDTESLAVGAYGTADHTASVGTVRSLRGSPGSHANRTFLLENPGGDEIQVTLNRRERFHVIRDGEPVSIANRRALQRAFDDHSRAIRRFVRREDIDFSNAEDMVRTLEHIQSLEE